MDSTKPVLDLDAIEARANAATSPKTLGPHAEPRSPMDAALYHLGQARRELLAGVTNPGPIISGKVERIDFAAAAIAQYSSDVPALAAEARRLRKALVDILAVSKDRARFVAQGPRGWLKAEQIASAALRASGIDPDAP